MGINTLTIRGPEEILDAIHNMGASLPDYGRDISSAIIETYSYMYFGENIKVLGRTDNCLVISYKSTGGILVNYLEALLLRYRKCFFNNHYKDGDKMESWMARVVGGKVKVLTEDLEGLVDYELPG